MEFSHFRVQLCLITLKSMYFPTNHIFHKMLIDISRQLHEKWIDDHGRASEQGKVWCPCII